MINNLSRILFFCACCICVTCLHYSGSSRGLTEVPEGIPVDATEIYLHHNSITTIGPNDFSKFTYLSYLWLNNNNISIIHKDAFVGLVNLEHLYLSDNGLKEAPFLPNMSLNTLVLSGNKIREIPNETAISCRYLQLNNNGFEKFPKMHSSTLTKLYLAGNNITIIPDDSLDGLTQLSNLELETIGNGELSKLKSSTLTTLELHFNYFRKIDDDAFSGLINLHSLYLYHNELEEMPIFRISTLEVLYLSGNEIRTIPDGALDGLVQLKTLRLSISKFESLLNLRSSTLESLTLFSVTIRSFPYDALDGLTNLKDLYLEVGLHLLLECDCRFPWLRRNTPINIYGIPIIQCSSDEPGALIRLTEIPLDQLCPVTDVADCIPMQVEPTSGPTSGGTNITVTGKCLPGSLQLGNTTLYSSQLDAHVFETKAVNTPGTVPITIVIPLRNDIHAITLDQNFTFEGRTPNVRDIHPKELTVHGGTKLTVLGSNFEAESNPQMNLTQKAISTLDGTKTFDEVKYPPTPCSVLKQSEMTCKTPELQLPSSEEFGSFKAEYRFGFIFDGFEEAHDVEGNITSEITVEIAVVELHSISEHHWPPYDATKRQPLHIEIFWGHFQHEAVVRVGGIRSNITERLVNRLLFLPPDEAQLKPESGCKNSNEAHSVEVAAGNTNQRVGCLTYDPDDDTPLRMILVFAVCGVVAVVVVASIIAFYIVQKRKNKDGE